MPLASEIYYFIHSKDGAGQIPIVFIHGAGGTHLNWPPEIRRLPGFQIYAIDLPGHGKSPGKGENSILAYCERVTACMDEIGLKKVILTGHSMGGAIAMMMALEYPMRVHSLILLGTGARLRVHPDILASNASQDKFPSVVEMVIDWGFSPQASSRLVELASQRMMKISPEVLHADFKACDGFDVSMRLDEIACPTLVICGEHDRLTPLRYAQFLADQIRGAKLEIIPGSGHMVMLEKPQEVQTIMLRFLQQLTGHK